MATDNRPLSPYLGIYRWQITMTMSIVHRITGVALAMGTLGLVYWFVAVAAGPAAYSTAHRLFATWLGQSLMWGWTLCLFYHLCNGIRHLFWDAGKGFTIPQLYASGYTVWVVALILTLVTLVLAYVKRGAA